MANFTRAREVLVARLLEGHGEAATSDRRAAFDGAVRSGPRGALLEKVARHASRVTDEDVTAARASGLTENEMFELVVCAAVGEASRQYDAAMGALMVTIEEN